MACLDAKNGRILWRADLRAAHLSTPAIETTIDGKIWVYSAGDDGAVFRLNGATGKRDGGGWKTFVAAQPEQWSLWSSRIPTREPVAAVLRGEPLLKEYSWGTRLVLGGEDGALRCFDAENGRLLWTFDAGASVQSRPATLRLSQGKAEHDFLLVAGADRCYAIDARRGQRIWEWQTDEVLRGAPLLDEDTIWMVTESGRILRFAIPEFSTVAALSQGH
jgi:outer membrane protein assembly factor BamB